MTLDLYLLTAAGTDPRNARVVSPTDFAPNPLPGIIFGETLDLNVYLVSGSGTFDAKSGAVGVVPRIAIGQQGSAAVALTETFTTITNGWSCSLELTTTNLLQVLSALAARKLAIEFSTTTTPAGKRTTWASLPLEIIGRVADPETGEAVAAPAFYTAAQADALFVLLNDSRLSDSRTPKGGAGGVLSGSFPNPGFAVDMATQAELSDGLAAKQPLSTTLTRVAAGDMVRSLLEFGGSSVDAGDGSANVTAFNNAIAAMPNGGRIVLPAGGTYRLNSSISLPSGMVVDAAGATIKVLGSFAAFTTNGALGVRIVGATIVGPSQDYAGTLADRGIDATGSTALRVHGCSFGLLTHGIYGAQASMFSSEDCVFRTISGTAIRLPDARHASIRNPDIDGLRTGLGDGCATRVGVWFPEGTYAGNDNEIIGGVVKNCYNECVNVRSARTVIDGTRIQMPAASSAAFFSGYGSGGIVVEGTANSYTPGTPRAGSYLTITNVQLSGTFVAIRVDPANPGAAPTGITIDNVQISDIGYAVQALQIVGESASNPLADVRLSNIRIYNVATAGSTAIYLRNVQNVTLDGFDINGADSAVSLSGSASGATKNATIRNGSVVNAKSVVTVIGSASGAIAGYTVEAIRSATGTASVTNAFSVDTTTANATSGGVWRNLTHHGATAVGFRLSGDLIVTSNLAAPDATTAVQFAGTYTHGVAPTSIGAAAASGEDYSIAGATNKNVNVVLGGTGSLSVTGGNGGATGTVDIVSASNTSGLRGTNNTGNAVAKEFKFGLRHYTAAEEDVMMLDGNSTSGNSTVIIGGGSSTHNAATRVDINAAANTTTTSGTQVVRFTAGGINIGAGASGTAIDWVGSATASLDFPSIAAGGSADLTITVTGASVGDAVVLGLPASPPAGIVFIAFVSAANTVTIRAINITASPVDPASATYRATVISH